MNNRVKLELLQTYLDAIKRKRLGSSTILLLKFSVSPPLKMRRPTSEVKYFSITIPYFRKSFQRNYITEPLFDILVKSEENYIWT